MNYLFFGGRFKLRYAYVDLNVDHDYIGDSLFYKKNIPVKFGNEYIREGDKYRVITCKIPRKYKDAFEDALKELETKMCLFGYNDYEEYCKNLMKELEAEKWSTR
jgi:hypothetical protein